MASLEYREREEGAVEGVQVFYADDMTVERIDGTVRLTYWERRRVDGKIVTVPILEVIRAAQSFKCPCCLIGPGPTH